MGEKTRKVKNSVIDGFAKSRLTGENRCPENL